MAVELSRARASRVTEGVPPEFLRCRSNGVVACYIDATTSRLAQPARSLTTKGYDHKTPIRTSFDQRFDRYSQLAQPAR